MNPGKVADGGTEPPSATIDLFKPNPNANPQQVFNTRFDMVRSVVQDLYPNLMRQVQGYQALTPDYASPEQSGSTYKEADQISDLCYSLRGSNPFLYRTLLPASRLFRRFLLEFTKVMFDTKKTSMTEAVNAELVYRLNIKRFEQIKGSVAKLKELLDSFKHDRDQLQTVGMWSHAEGMCRTFDAFWAAFSQIQSIVDQGLHRTYQLVKDQRWDKTRPAPDLGPRGEEDADFSGE